MLQLLITFKSKRAQGGVGLPPESDAKVQRVKVVEREELNWGCCLLADPLPVFLLNPGIMKDLSNVTVLWKDGIILFLEGVRQRQRQTETETETVDLTVNVPYPCCHSIPVGGAPTWNVTVKNEKYSTLQWNTLKWFSCHPDNPLKLCCSHSHCHLTSSHYNVPVA